RLVEKGSHFKNDLVRGVKIGSYFISISINSERAHKATGKKQVIFAHTSFFQEKLMPLQLLKSK
ncbi:MAG TPA: hypothetical protein VEY32_13455, partial [Flavisolibacter sp.]|nr:hypothetical protein [Flavisolibacter sp.]